MIRVQMFGLNMSQTHGGKDHSAPIKRKRGGGCIHASLCM